MTIEDLTHEFKVVANAAVKIGANHTVVAAKCGISTSLLSAYRTGARVPPADKKALIVELIQAYRKEIERKNLEVNTIANKVLPKRS